MYDEETGFYYCTSRYYDPEIGRWINQDNVISGVGESVQGYNMFAYCFNNPVNMSDPSGDWPSWDDFCGFWDKLWKTGRALIRGLEGEVGVGAGAKGSVNIVGFDTDVGVKADVLNLEYTYDDGLELDAKSDYGIALNTGFVNWGYQYRSEYPRECNPYEEDCVESETLVFAEFDPVIELAGIELYAMFGFTANLRYNLQTVGEELIKVYEE